MSDRESESAGTASLHNDVRALVHDLRNPLGAITLSVETLRECLKGEEAARLKPLDVIRRSAGRMQAILDQLANTVLNPATRLGGPPPASARDDASRNGRALTAESLQTLGLAFVHELVRLQGGDITPRNEAGGATSFAITLPPAATPRAPIPAGVAAAVQTALRWLPDEALRRTLEGALPQVEVAASDLPPPPGARVVPCEGRILLAEDNAELRAYVEQLLSDRWRVDAVGDGTSALHMAREHPPDLVLADIMMPGIDGLSLVRALRAEEGTKSIPILLLSAQVGQESKMEGSLAGADDYLVKPFSARELIARVALHLELGRVRARLAHEQARAQRAEHELKELSQTSAGPGDQGGK